MKLHGINGRVVIVQEDCRASGFVQTELSEYGKGPPIGLEKSQSEAA
jgi:hypothetical protein